MNDYVFPSVDDLNDGCGVLVGNLFVTAGHVVANHSFYLYIEGEKIVLNKEEAIVYEYNLEANGADIAIFKLNNYKSPLQLGDYKPIQGDILESISFERMVEPKKDLGDIIFNSQPKEWYEKRLCYAIVEEIDANFYECKTSIVLKPGSSGSPLIKDGIVCGILSSGQLGVNRCVFQSSSSILLKLKNLNLL